MDNSPHPHPGRLPLGAPWKGKCSAAAQVPTESYLSHCNLGYSKCSHLPADRTADAVRFSVAATSNGKTTLRYACELKHRPADCGTLEFDRHQKKWAKPHPDSRLQKMAECFMRVYLERSGK